MLLDYVVVSLAYIFYKRKKKREEEPTGDELHIRSFLVCDTTVIIVDHGAPDSCGSVKPACQLPQGQLLLVCVSLPKKRCHWLTMF